MANVRIPSPVAVALACMFNSLSEAGICVVNCGKLEGNLWWKLLLSGGGIVRGWMNLKFQSFPCLTVAFKMNL